MKQKIYEIPIWDAFQLQNCECALCAIEKKSEDNFITTLFSEMVMDVRLNPHLVEDYEFCNDHFEKLYRYPDKCGLAVLTNRILSSKRQNLKIPKSTPEKLSKFSFKNILKGNQLSESNINYKQCLLCSKLNKDMINYEETFINLWLKDEKFRDIYKSSKGLCFKHYNATMSHSKRIITDTEKLKEFEELNFALQEESLERLKEELEWFISKFDYRFANEPWKNSKDSLLRSIQKIIGNYNTKI